MLVTRLGRSAKRHLGTATTPAHHTRVGLSGKDLSVRTGRGRKGFCEFSIVTWYKALSITAEF